MIIDLQSVIANLDYNTNGQLLLFAVVVLVASCYLHSSVIKRILQTCHCYEQDAGYTFTIKFSQLNYQLWSCYATNDTSATQIGSL